MVAGCLRGSPPPLQVLERSAKHGAARKRQQSDIQETMTETIKFKFLPQQNDDTTLIG